MQRFTPDMAFYFEEEVPPMKESPNGKWVKWGDVQAITVHEQERLRCTNACMALYQSTSVKDISSATSEMQMCWAAGRRIQAKLYPEES